MKGSAFYFAYLSIILIVSSAVLAGPTVQRAPAYPLKKILPKPFEVCKGIIDWVPVSATKGVAFARDATRQGQDRNLKSFTLSGNGATGTARTVAENMGMAFAAACVWIDQPVTRGAAASPYGLVFVIFNISEHDSEKEVVRVAKFNSSGAILGTWKDLMSVNTPSGWYFTDESIFACRNGESIGVVPSFVMGKSASHGGYQSKVFLLESNAQDGTLIGEETPLALPDNGVDVEGRGFVPLWNSASWLVPVTVSLYEPATGWMRVLENRALVFAVSGQAARATTYKQIGKDKADSPETYSELFLAPYPGSATDALLFVRHRKPIAAAQQKLDMFEYDYALKRLNSNGKPVKSLSLAIPAPTHKRTYDPAWKIWWEYDYWSECVLKGNTLFISQAHTLDRYKESPYMDDFEQAVGFYAIDTTTGAVQLKAQTVNIWDGVSMLRPFIDSFSESTITVVNSAYHETEPYARDNYISLFGSSR